MNRPDSFAPIPGVLYFTKPNDSESIRRGIRENWRSIEDSDAGLVLFNGVWTLMPDVQDRIVALAKGRHVVVADRVEVGLIEQLHRRRQSVSIVRVVPAPNKLIRLMFNLANSRP